jgi:SAM-dependent methyltransferase
MSVGKIVEWDPEAESAAYDRGYYERSARGHDRAVPAFADWIRGLGVRSVLDLGCGSGAFLEPLVDDLAVLGVDIGADAGYLLPDRFVRADLTRPLWDQIPPFFADLVLCLEVYEHLPAQFEEQLIANLLAPDPRLIVLSVAVARQWGRHHYNCRGPEYAKAQMAERGWIHDEDLAAPLRTMKYLATYYRRNTLVLRRPEC